MTRFRKVSGRRTLIVSLLSLTLVIVLASGGDRLFSALKGGNEKEADTAPPPSAGKTLQERQNLGMDSNPFGLFGPHTQDETDPARQAVTPAPTLPPAPPALNKAAALADGLNNARTMPGDTARTSPGETRSHAETSNSPSSSTTYTSCPSVLTRERMATCAARRLPRRKRVTTTIRASPVSPASDGWASILISISRWTAISRVR